MGALTEAVRTLQRSNETTTEQLTRQTAAIASLEAMLTNGIFVRPEALDAVILAAVDRHERTCPVAIAVEEDRRAGKERRESWRDRIALRTLLLRCVATAASVLGGLGAARMLGIFKGG